MCEEFVNILIYNWRDIKNPAAGGAEVLTHEIAKRLVLRGNLVFKIEKRSKAYGK